MASIGILIAIIVYLVMMVYVGFYFSKGEGKEDSTDHFYLGGRQLGPFVTAMSAEASDEQLAADGTSWSGLSDRYF